MPRDGISSVERRASIRATSDIELTYGSFSAVTFFTSTVSPFEADTWKQTAGVVSTGQTHSKLLSNIKRNSYFAPSALNAAAASATKKEDGAAVTSKATLSVELDLNAKTEAEEDENHDNTASYKKVREIIFGQAMRYVNILLSSKPYVPLTAPICRMSPRLNKSA